MLFFSSFVTILLEAQRRFTLWAFIFLPRGFFFKTYPILLVYPYSINKRENLSEN